jgi:hypothetical protein
MINQRNIFLKTNPPMLRKNIGGLHPVIVFLNLLGSFM